MRQVFTPFRLIAAALVLIALAQTYIAYLEFWPWSAGLERAFAYLVGAAAVAILLIIALVLLIVAWFRRGQHEHRRLFFVAVGLFAALPVLNALLLFWLPTPERLVRAASQGNVAVVERCLWWGVNPDSTYIEVYGFGGRGMSQTALQSAAAAGRAEVVKLLLDAGADYQLEDKNGRSACDLAEIHDEIRALMMGLCEISFFDEKR